MRLFIYLAMMLVYCTSSSCVPLRYNSKNWNSQKISPEYIGSIKIGCVLMAENSNAFNSNNAGPWKILFVFTSKVKGNVEVADIQITTLRGEQIARLDEEIELVFQLRENQTWGAFKKTEESINLPFKEGDEIRLIFRVRANGGAWHKISTKFKAKHIKGTEVINFLTM